MKRSTALSAAAALAACLLAWVWQRGDITSLEREVAGIRRQVVDARSRAAAGGGVAFARPGSPSNQASASRGGAGSPRTIASVAQLRALMPNDRQALHGTEAYALIPKVVEVVEGCSADQLLAIAGALGVTAGGKAGANQLDSFIQMLILIMVGEDDPARALAYIDEQQTSFGTGFDMRISLLAELAKRDPTLSLAKAAREGMSQREINMGRAVVARELLRSDAATGLEILADIGGDDFTGGMSTIAVAARDPQAAANLWREANRREPGDIRSGVLGGLMAAAMLEGGSEAVDEAFAKIENLGDGERTQLVATLADSFVSMEPEWTMGFVREQSAGSHRPEALRDAVVSWARRDYNAAGQWLGEQPPSPERDTMIAGYAKQVAEVDPKAALAWTQEIGDPELRARAADRVQRVGAPAATVVPEPAPAASID